MNLNFKIINSVLNLRNNHLFFMELSRQSALIKTISLQINSHIDQYRDVRPQFQFNYRVGGQYKDIFLGYHFESV